MESAVQGGDSADIPRMQAGVRAWVSRITRDRATAVRQLSPAALLSVSGAAALSPLIGAGAGITGALSVAGISVLSSIGGGVLSGVLGEALDNLRSNDQRPAPPGADLENEIANQLHQVLVSNDEHAQALRNEIAAVLEAIDFGGTALRAAIESGTESVRSDVIAVISILGTGFAELGFLVDDVTQAAAAIQASLDEQGATLRAVIDQNVQQSADIRMAREEIAVIEKRTRSGQRVVTGTTPEVRWRDESPYRGLLPYRENDADLFYGRERLTTELLVKLSSQVTRPGLVVVTGASGAGKSSLLQAGLLPALARGVQVQGSQRWPRVVMTPTRDALTELATRLAAISGSDAIQLRASLAEEPGLAHLAVGQAVAADAARRNRPAGEEGRLLLVVDQFEQIFTLSSGHQGESGRQAFITALCAAATLPAGPDGQPAAVVVVAVRGDFWDQCAAYPDLARELQNGQFVVGPMDQADLRLAILGPAEAAGLSVEPGLIDIILADLRDTGDGVSAGVLPLLSQAMLLTWQNRDGERLTARGYGQGGGVRFAVQASADAAYGSLAAGQQALARDILRNMVAGSSQGRLTRRPVNTADLHEGHSEADKAGVDAVLEAFVARRLIIVDGGRAQIAHDALLTAWPRLSDWLKDDQASWIFHGQLADDAAAWRQHGGEPSFLYRGTQLAALRQAVTSWSASPGRYPVLTGDQRDFLNASERAATRARRRRQLLAASLVVLLIASIISAGLAVTAASNASSQRDLAASGQLAAESREFYGVDPVFEALLAAAAQRVAPTAQARASMLDAYAQPERAILQVSGVYGGYGTAVTDVAFSPDGKILATAGGDGMARLWDLATHRQIGKPMMAATGSLVPPITGGLVTQSVNWSLTFSPDGRTLATAVGQIRLWDVATQRQIGSAFASGSAPYKAAFSTDGKILATAGSDDTARLWDVATHRQIGSPMRASHFFWGVADVAFSPDNQVLATGAVGGKIQLWDVRTQRPIGAPLTPYGGDPRDAPQLAFSPDGKVLAAGSAVPIDALQTEPYGTVRLWDVATRRQIAAPIHVPGGGGAVAFSPDGKILAIGAGDGMARLWDVGARQQTGSVNVGAGVFAVAFSPNGQTLATADDDGTVRLWDVRIYSRIGSPMGAYVSGFTSPYGENAAKITFSRDGRYLATGDADGTVRLWDAATQRQICQLLTGSDVSHGTEAVAFSPDGKILVTAGEDGIRFWDMVTCRQAGPLVTSTHGADAVVFSPDDSTLVIAGNDGTVLFWNVVTHRVVSTLVNASSDPSLEVVGVAFSPDGKTFATARNDGTAWLWNVATHHQIGPPIQAAQPPNSVTAVAFSPDGTMLATASNDATARLWDVATRRQIGAPMVGPGAIASIAFSSDGQFLATGDASTARLWDVDTQQQIGPPMTQVGGLSAVALSPGGKLLATGGPDGTVELWNVAFPGDLLEAMCSIAGRSLTRQEWPSYTQSVPYQDVCP